MIVHVCANDLYIFQDNAAKRDSEIMFEMSQEELRNTLANIKNTMMHEVETVLQIVDFLVAQDGVLHLAGCLSYIQNIQQAVTVLKTESIKLLEKELTLSEPDLSNYLSKIRHDLRNPINAMQGYAEICLEEFQAADKMDLVNKMDTMISIIRKILSLVNDINVAKHISHAITTTDSNGVSVSHVIRDNEFIFNQGSSTEELIKFKEEISILVVDDIEENCKILNLFLNRIGYKNIHSAFNGKQALQLIDSNDFSIILLDIDMPDMTGIEVLLHIKQHVRSKDIMVMMISAADTMENTIKCIQLGAEDFLPKPFNRDLLRVRMGACVEKKWSQNKVAQYHKQLEIEKQKYEKLLNTILPPSIVIELATENKVTPRYYQNVAVLFVDVVGFTTYCDTHQLHEVEENLEKFSELCEEIAIKYNIQKIKTIGDAFLATAGMLTENNNPVLDCVHCAAELLVNSVKILPAKWRLRAGVAFGTVIGGVIGHRQFLFDIWGDTVNTASRIQSAADPDSIFLTKQAWEKIEEFARSQSMGSIQLKGKPSMELFKYIGIK